MTAHSITYRHVDVFTNTPLSGNGLTVFTHCADLSNEKMQMITQEMRQFESIFLFPTQDQKKFKARIFTMEEELDFAGHPILGAAAVLHEKEQKEICEWFINLPQTEVKVTTRKFKNHFHATMDQGKPCFITTLNKETSLRYLNAFNLENKDQHLQLPLQVITTGLPYLIIPIQSNLDKVKIVTPHLEKILGDIGAKFAYVLDVENMEGRTWDNEGRVEDIATGSAAGPVGAFLIHHQIVKPNLQFVLNQGRFLNRPSQIYIDVECDHNHEMTSIKVSGDVCMVASGIFD